MRVPEAVQEYVPDLFSRQAQTRQKAPAISISNGRILCYRGDATQRDPSTANLLNHVLVNPPRLST